MRSRFWIFIPLLLLIVSVWAGTRFDSNEAETDLLEQEQSLSITDEVGEKPPVELVPDKQFGLLEKVFGTINPSYSIHSDRVHKNEFLADMMGGCNVDYSTVAKLVEKTKGIFDVRKMKYNRPYTVLCNDSLERAEFFIYEHDPMETVIFDLRDTLNVVRYQKEIDTLIREASGVINYSLYQTLMDQKLSPMLVGEMENVYAWALDFFRIQKGDRFKVVFEELYADGEFIGVGSVQSSVFYHSGQPFYAFYFDHEDLEHGDYYDEEYKSLRKAFLKAPVKYSRISSRYSSNRRHPVLGYRKAHLGTDYAAPRGTPIYATANGTITHRTRNRGNGKYVKVRHNSVYTTQYLHMSGFAKGQRVGTVVKQGDVIGYVGSTGLATGPHVCYRFWKNGKQVDPYKQKLPDSKSLKTELIPTYDLHIDSMMCRLDKIDFVEENSLTINN